MKQLFWEKFEVSKPNPNKPKLQTAFECLMTQYPMGSLSVHVSAVAGLIFPISFVFERKEYRNTVNIPKMEEGAGLVYLDDKKIFLYIGCFRKAAHAPPQESKASQNAAESSSPQPAFNNNNTSSSEVQTPLGVSAGSNLFPSSNNQNNLFSSPVNNPFAGSNKQIGIGLGLGGNLFGSSTDFQGAPKNLFGASSPVNPAPNNLFSSKPGGGLGQNKPLFSTPSKASLNGSENPVSVYSYDYRKSL